MLNKWEIDQLLKLIREEGASMEQILQDTLQYEEAVSRCQEELCPLAARIEFLDNLQQKLQGMSEEQDKYLCIDADHQGELLVLCSVLHASWVQEFENTVVRNMDELMYQFYLLGNIEGQLLNGHITNESLDMLMTWEQELSGDGE